MTTFIEDSPRPSMVGWMRSAQTAGHSTAVVIDPWLSPYEHRTGPGMKPGIGPRTEELRTHGMPYWLDPMTHVHDMPGTRDFSYYGQYDLWGGAVGNLTDTALRAEHVRRVFALQDEIAARHLAPTVLLPTGLNTLSTIALDLSRCAMDQDSGAMLSLAGEGTFWADGPDLNAHVGSLAALQPQGWFISIARENNNLPPSITADQVFGICRTVRALSEHAPVYVSHGDLVGLPAVAAGAFAVGTGWDKRQRTLGYSDYVLREDGPGGRWPEGATFGGLLGTLTKANGALLQRQDRPLGDRLGGFPIGPGMEQIFLKHVEQLSGAVQRVSSAGTGYEPRFRELDKMYDEARANWSELSRSTAIPNGTRLWIEPMQTGLRMYARSEGWIV